MSDQRDKDRAAKLSQKATESAFDQDTKALARQRARDERDKAVNNSVTRAAGTAPETPGTTPGSEFREGQNVLDIVDRLDPPKKRKGAK